MPPSNPKFASASVSPASGVVAPAPAPEEAAPSVVVQTGRKLEFMTPPEAPKPATPSKFSAKVLAEHAAGAEALSNYR